MIFAAIDAGDAGDDAGDDGQDPGDGGLIDKLISLVVTFMLSLI
jgi:hypothetical protein